MRRNSLVAPLLLIGLGALLLARTLYPELPLLEYISRYWPLILIVWGVLRIAEITAWAAASKPLPVNGISSGEWVMIVFLCLFGTSLHTVRGGSRWWSDHVRFDGFDLFSGQSYEYPLRGEQPSSRTPHVLIEDFRGDAKINGVDSGPGADTVKVTGHKTIRGLNQQQSDRRNETAPLEFTGDADHIVIHLNQGQTQMTTRVSASLDINVPRGASVEVHGRNGYLEINDISGSVTIASDNAGVRLKNIGGDARVDLRHSDLVHMSGVKGAVAIKGRGSDIQLEDVGGPVSVNGTYFGIIALEKVAKPLHFAGPQSEINIQSIPGQVNISGGEVSASKVTGPVHLSARSRDVQINDFTGPLDVTLERGDLSLRPGLPLGRIQAHSRSGDIRLSLPAAAQFTLIASTNNGDISNPFGGGLALDTKGRHGTLRGSVGGGAMIEIETQRGDITVQKAVAAGANPPLEKLDQ
jgi:DUF4097 and DUF4098 domain-containing protein YvlB